jgi:hypothetical protein
MDKIDFRLGQIQVALEIPPFFVNFDKRDFSSIMTREEKEGRKALFYVYISRKNQLSKLLLLKAMHPDIFIPVTLKINEEIDKNEINTFMESVYSAEKEWLYHGSGLWEKTFSSCKVFMVLIIGEDRWTVRPLVAKEGLTGFGAEIPVEKNLSPNFLDSLEEDEKKGLEKHEHVDNLHFHFTVHSVARFIQLVKEWDYYFAHRERWRMSVKIP